MKRLPLYADAGWSWQTARWGKSLRECERILVCFRKLTESIQALKDFLEAVCSLSHGVRVAVASNVCVACDLSAGIMVV